MPFGNTSEPSLIYRYGCKAPIAGADIVVGQMSKAHRYANLLTEIERRRRERVAEIVAQLSPELARRNEECDHLRATIAECRQRIKAIRQRDRKRTAVPDDLRGELTTAQTAYREASAARKLAKAEAYDTPAAKIAMAYLDDVTRDAKKTARSECGLYWGTYLQIEAAADQARKSKTPPQFRRWIGDGKIAVQLQGGLSVEDAFGGNDTRFRIDPIAYNAWDKGVPKKAQRTTAWLRVGSENRQPVWAGFPVTLHRPLPDGATIKWVYAIRRRTACHDTWSLCIVLGRACGWAKTDTADGGSVGIDVGWRKTDTGLRVAYWVGSDGASDEVVISERDASQWQKADDLQAIRGQRFEAARAELADWLAGRDVPDWLTETAHIRQWHAQAKLAVVALAWRDQRFAGDDDAFTALEAWRKKDKHLYEWEVNQRRKATAWRLDMYRRVAADLSRRYHTARIEDTDWRDLARTPKPEEASEGSTRYWMRVASPGLFLQVIRHRFAAVEIVSAKNTTQRCYACGELTGFDARANLSTTCRHCGARWDQDANAAANLLASAPVA